MTITAPTILVGSSRTRSGLWREEVLDRAGRLESELASLPPTGQHVELAREHLVEAVTLTGTSLRPLEWWTGSRTETCWRHLRLAEEALLEVGTPAQVRARVDDALTHATFYLGADDTRTTNLSAALAEHGEVAELVPVARVALGASHEASDRLHRERRSFLNALRAIVGVLVVLAGLLLTAVHLGEWDLLTGPTGESSVVLVGLALGFGALGALFSAVPSLAQMPTIAQAFSPVRTQAVLKVVVGAWSAVVGLMAVTAGLQTTSGGAPADTANLAGFALVAALFGASQEALTRFADHKAAGLDTGTSASSG